MAELRITKKIGNQHQHIVYLRDNDKGVTSGNSGHSHDVYFGPSPETLQIVEQMQMQGQLAVSQGADPQQVQAQMEQQLAVLGKEKPEWRVVEAEGHTHEITDLPELKAPEKDKDDTKLVNEVLEDFTECFNHESKSRARAREAEKMVCHDQWEEGERPDGNRASLTINVLEDKIDNLSGYQRQNRTDIHFLPVEGGDAIGADILNVSSKVILDNCFYQREKSKVFEDAAITGRGLFDIREDYERNLLGELMVEQFPWDDCHFGPHNKEDLSDCEVMFKEKWYSESNLRSEWEEKLKKSPVGEDDKAMDIPLEPSEDWDKRLSEMNLVDKNAKKYKLLERCKKVYKRSKVLVNPADGFVMNTEGWDKQDVEWALTIPGMTSIPVKTYRLRITTIVSTVLLDDKYTEDMDFEIVPVYAKKRRDMWWGKIEGVKDLQRLINKTYSQFIDIIAKVANYGYFYDSDTFDNVKDEQAWKENASSPGFTAKIRDINKRPVKEEGVRFPQEIVNAIQLFQGQLREILNINLEMQGMKSDASSGIAIKQKVVQQLLGNDFLFDNMTFAEKLVGRIFIRKFQKLYGKNPDRLMRILVNQNMKEKSQGGEGIKIGGQEFDKYPAEEIRKLLETRDYTLYDVVVSESPNAPSAMMSGYLMLLEMARAGQQVPPDMFIELSPLPDDLKKRMMASLQAAAKAAKEAEDKKYDTEIQKTGMALQAKQMDKNPVQQAGNMPMGGMPPQGMM